MTAPRDKNGLSLHRDDSVICKVGDGPEAIGTVEHTEPQNPALAGCVLVRFSNESAQWMPTHHLEFLGR